MVLESQMIGGRGSRVYSRSRRRRLPVRLIATLVVLGLVAVACYYMIKGSGGEVGGGEPNVVGAGGNPEPGASSPTPDGPSHQDPSLTQIGMGPTRHSEPVDPPAPDRRSDPPPPPPVGPASDQPDPIINSSSDVAVASKIEQGRRLIQQKQLVAGRDALNQALHTRGLSSEDAAEVRQELAAVNEKLVFSPLVDEADPFTKTHVIEPGQMLAKIAPRYNVPWRFIARINRITDPRRIRAGQRLKVVTGPFHVVVHKTTFRADVYLNDKDGKKMFVRSYRVGLGAFDSTPTGSFVVRKHSKLINPEWVNPRTGQRYHPDDPTNPIGERWIGLEGADANTKALSGYGLHGTIAPKSIGTQSSMGCVRFMPDDIALLFDMLSEGQSTVTIAN